MKKFITILSNLLLFATVLSAQTKDTVSTGAGYASIVFYNFETDKETRAAATSWDLAISVRQQDAAVFINPISEAYRAVNSGAKWTDVKDTLSATAANFLYNSDTTWFVGALNSTRDLAQQFDYGWGTYNGVTRNVIGDSVYLVKTASRTWKKLFIEKIVGDSAYTLKFANLDGSDEKTMTFTKGTYPKRNFVYVSLANNTIQDLEPDNDKWDVMFTRYHGKAINPMTGKLEDYPSNNGLLQNSVFTLRNGRPTFTGVQSVKVIRTDRTKNNYDPTKLSYNIASIGGDWKSLTSTAPPRFVLDTTVTYFLKNIGGKVYKVIFTGFGGGSNGNFIFTREQMLTATSTKDVLSGEPITLAVSPNPVSNGNLTIAYDLGKRTQRADFQLINLSGQVVFSQKIASNTEGVQVLSLPSVSLTSGLYFAKLTAANRTAIVKVIIQ